MKKNIIYICVVCFFFNIYSCIPTARQEEVRTENIATCDLSPMQDDSIIVVAARSEMEEYLEHEGLVNIQTLDSTIRVDLKYSTLDNFTKTILYDDLTKAYLHPLAGQKLIVAQKLLKEINPSYSLLVYDAARPMSVQKKMYAVVQNTPYHAYVANPTRTGLHNYGMAVDLTIVSEDDNKALDMGTSFDYFGRAAGINNEDQLKREGILNEKQLVNRRLLRKVMTEAGFLTIRGEWWHFNALSLIQAKKETDVIQ